MSSRVGLNSKIRPISKPFQGSWTAITDILLTILRYQSLALTSQVVFSWSGAKLYGNLSMLSRPLFSSIFSSMIWPQPPHYKHRRCYSVLYRSCNWAGRMRKKRFSIIRFEDTQWRGIKLFDLRKRTNGRPWCVEVVNVILSRPNILCTDILRSPAIYRNSRPTLHTKSLLPRNNCWFQLQSIPCFRKFKYGFRFPAKTTTYPPRPKNKYVLSQVISTSKMNHLSHDQGTI